MKKFSDLFEAKEKHSKKIKGLDYVRVKVEKVEKQSSGKGYRVWFKFTDPKKSDWTANFDSTKSNFLNTMDKHEVGQEYWVQLTKTNYLGDTSSNNLIKK